MDEEKQGVPSPEGEVSPGETTVETTAVVVQSGVVQSGGARPPAVPPPPPADEDDDPEEHGMLRMSFMEHLEELRSRIIKALMGLLVAFVLSLGFCNYLWEIISEPAVSALKHLGVVPPRLVQITPMESFSIIWVQLPLLCSVFLASPWIVGLHLARPL
jgi:sec-independent protein translocase protein TatC